MKYFSIDSAGGTNMCAGIEDEAVARRTAQQLANELGEVVFLYSDEPGDGEVIEPEQPDANA